MAGKTSKWDLNLCISKIYMLNLFLYGRQPVCLENDVS